MAQIFFMRFRTSNPPGDIYLVGTSIEKMRQDAVAISWNALTDPGGELITDYDRVLDAALNRGVRADGRTHQEMLDLGVDAARSGTQSFYIF